MSHSHLHTHVRTAAGLLLALALAVPGSVSVAGGLPRPEEVVAPTPFLSLSGLHPGGQLRLALAGDVIDGWHVNAHEPSADYLIPTSLQLKAPPGLKISEATYPDGEMVTFEFADEPLLVYEGRFYILLTISAAAGADTGSRWLEGILSYQPCSDRICLPPADVPFEIEIAVVPTDQAVSPLWPEIFAELMVRHGIPEHIRSDNGPEMVAQDLREWLGHMGSKTAYITPGSS